MSNDILIRSASRHSSSVSSSNCIINFPNQLDLKQNQKLKLEYFQFFNTIYNIDANNNNLNFNENSTNKAITAITPGSYDANGLATAVQSALNTASGGYNTYAVTYSSTTKLYTISAGNSFTLLFNSGALASTSLFREMGFINASGTTSVDSSTGTSTTSPYPVNFTYPQAMYIRIPGLLNSTYVSSDGDFFTYFIPASAANGNIVEYKSKDQCDQIATILDNNLRSIQVMLYGPPRNLSSTANNATINLNNSDWIMILKRV